jgi:hypothetical protein
LLAGNIGEGFVTLRYKPVAAVYAQLALAPLDVLSNGSLGKRAVATLLTYSLPDPMRSMSLLARRFPVRFQNRIDEVSECFYLPRSTYRGLSFRWHCVRHRLPHHAPMNAQFLRHPGDRPYSKLILASDLFEQLHLPSPVQPLPSDRALAPASEYPVGLASGVGQFKPPN